MIGGILGWFTLHSVIPERAKRESGIHLAAERLEKWIPGLRRSAHPGMTCMPLHSRAANRLRVMSERSLRKQRAQGMPGAWLARSLACK
jgi:hypothetical protein